LDPTTGADFAKQLDAFSKVGMAAELVPTLQDGTIEENAALIAERLRAAAKSHPAERLIVVSGSKGGPETALALGSLLSAEESAHVKAWVSIGGILRGSPVADSACRWPSSWLVGGIFALKGLNVRSVGSMFTPASLQRFDGLRLPPHLLVVSYVGVPLSGQVSPEVASRYREIGKTLGPNDGLTPLVDELVPGGLAVVEMGVVGGAGPDGRGVSRRAGARARALNERQARRGTGVNGPAPGRPFQVERGPLRSRRRAARPWCRRRA
jgi:hypothetical protein